MDKFRTQQIEKQTTKELRAKLINKKSPEGLQQALDGAYWGVVNKPELYYLEISADGTSITVKNRADNTVFYYTDRPVEVQRFKEVGADK